ncbi:MAG: 30S ribosomal protein S16 [Ignavibacteriae bacterium]|nr:30S ribosomal protein S16 [Ignavibacteriota bacterium]
MAVKLRLLRMGKKRQPIYKVVAADVRSPRDGKIIEAVGSYNPKSNPAAVDLNEERVLYWLNCGAQPTITVKTLLNKEGILLKRDLKKQGLNESEINAKFEDWKNLKNSVLADKNAKAEKKKQEKAEADKKKLAQELKEKESENTEVKDTASGEVS